MKWICIASVLVGSLMCFAFPPKAFADIIIIQGPGGTQEGTIITFPTPPTWN
jgi:hypothetical protein